VKVTADTITDEQIRELRRTPGLPLSLVRQCDRAINEDEDGDDAWSDEIVSAARARCADAYNARLGGDS